MVSTTTHRATPLGRSPADRLPAPVRERRPAMLALAVLLIVIGALISALVVMRSGNKRAYLVLTHDVRVGQQINARDLGVTDFAVGSGVPAAGISADLRRAVVGEYATANLYAGTLANPRMFTRTSPIPDDAAVVGVVVGATQMPAGGIHAGDVVQVIMVPKDANSSPVTLVSAVRVLTVSGASDSTRVSLLIPAADAESVADAAAKQNISLVALPPSTTPVVAENTAGTSAKSSSTPSAQADPTAGSGT